MKTDNKVLSAMARNSLQYAFVAGQSFWLTDAPYTPAPPCALSLPPRALSKRCASFLAGNDRARLQYGLEAAFSSFEATVEP